MDEQIMSWATSRPEVSKIDGLVLGFILFYFILFFLNIASY